MSDQMARDKIADDRNRGAEPALADGPEPVVADDALSSSLVTAVLATPGVVRLEPTLQAALRRLGGSTGTGATGEVRVTRRGEIVDLSVDVVTEPDAQARRTAEAVRARLRTLLAEQGLQAGSVSVSVLSIELGLVPAGVPAAVVAG
ncbi:hypothetical protein SAMN04488543_2649 [Friedmanniella luteola]|uniref:Asp23 family, cell envelope-related function n=1 Tax=Friedmanniella luteola TaxID=546871 RepID=A0A1H1W4N1_9ACTN|nr:hypothetical protein [Friedmanniella luteola]SDS92258.1 hypothetical protein SAMN04488543_2649 [Friedmanniella luteola]